MITLEELTLYFYIACGIGCGCNVLLFILVIILFCKLQRRSKNKLNKSGRHTNMLEDFCYTNPTIVPGEELSRRGFSMYSGNNSTNEDFTGKKYQDFHRNSYYETSAKF